MHETINELIMKTVEGNKKWEQERRDLAIKMERTDLRKRDELLPSLRHASSKDYKKWLSGFVEKGGNPTHYYNYRMPSEFYVASKDFAMFPLYGAGTLYIIVPIGVSVDISEGLGHCTLFYMDEYEYKGHWIPVYEDTLL